MFFLAAFVVLIAAGVYLEKLTWTQVLKWCMVTTCLSFVGFRVSHSLLGTMVVLLFASSILSLVIFGQDITVPGSSRGL
jgi:hypothetical protein